MNESRIYLNLFQRRFGRATPSDIVNVIVPPFERETDARKRDAILQELWRLSGVHLWAWDTLAELCHRFGDRQEALPELLSTFASQALTDEHPKPKQGRGRPRSDIGENFAVLWLFRFLTKYFHFSKNKAYYAIATVNDEESDLVAREESAIRDIVEKMEKTSPLLFGENSRELFP